MNRINITLLFFAILLSCVVIGAYIYKFAIPSEFSLSSDSQAWSNFGGYLGGVLGPFFALLAFLGVLVTVHLQRIQVAHAKSQPHIDELQRLISSISTTIDKSLNSEPKITPATFKGKEHSFTIFLLISAAGTAAIQNSDNKNTKENHASIIDEIKSSIGNEVSCIAIEIHQLIWCLEQYVNAGGSAVVADYYKRRYAPVVSWLDAIGFIKNHERIQKYFNPKELRQFLNPDEPQVFKQSI